MSEIGLLIEPHTPLDEPFRQELESILAANPSVHDALKPTNEALAEQRSQFEAAPNEFTPDLRPTHLDQSAIAQQEQGLVALGTRIAGAEVLPNFAREAYRARIGELVNECRLVMASLNRDPSGFYALNIDLYGQPNATLFAATVDHFRARAHQALRDADATTTEVASRVLAVLPDQQGERELLTPDPELFHLARQSHWGEDGYYGRLLAGVEVPRQGLIGPELGELILGRVLANIGASHYLRRFTSGMAWSVEHQSAELRGPAQYDYPWERFVGLPAGHEAGSHILEYINGLRQPLQLCGIGLDRYVKTNEGRALLREQVVYGRFEEFAATDRWQDVLRRGLAVGLAIGDGGQPRSFGEMHAIMSSVDQLRELRRETPAADPRARAAERTWTLLATRIMRGTDGQGAYQKDRLYPEGNIACWQAFANDPQAINRGDSGKYDITNAQHLQIIQQRAA
jgi:hypothetical protein